MQLCELFTASTSWQPVISLFDSARFGVVCCDLESGIPIVKYSRRVVNFHGNHAAVKVPRVKRRNPVLRDAREISIVHYGKW